MKVTLVVIRCEDIEVSKGFYEKLGFTFVREQHGNSPVHYSSTIDGTVLELYPKGNEQGFDNVRLGFEVMGLESIENSIEVVGGYEGDLGKVIVVIDPDGRKVELNQKCP